MAGAVYLLCALTALTCTVLLLRSYRQSGVRLLLWSGLCFLLLTVNNLLVFIDIQVIKDVSLLLWRNHAALGAFTLLIFGLVWDTK